MSAPLVQASGRLAARPKPRQLRTDDLHDSVGFLRELNFADTEETVTPLPKPEIPSVVGLEAHLSAVVPVTVGFDDETLLAPSKVDGERAEADVDLGPTQVVAPAEAEEDSLEVTPRRVQARDAIQMQA